MNSFRVALLDDNHKNLQKLNFYLDKIENVEVVLIAQNSVEFFEKKEHIFFNLLISNLDIKNDNMTGIDVANELDSIPIFFASNNTAEYIENIERLKRNSEICVEHLTMPFNEEEFVKTFKRFLKEVHFFSNSKYVHLEFGKSRHKILIDDIVYLSTDKKAGAESNNKQIHFTNRKQEILIDFSFSKMEEKGLLKEQFITIHKSYRVNKKYITNYDSRNEQIEIKVFDNHQLKSEKLLVSENYQKSVKAILK
jgi:hypothetical protein